MFFMTLDTILFRKKIKIITYFCPFLFFVYLLPSLTNKSPNTTLSVFEEGANEYNLSAELWLEGFDSVFWQVSIEFLFVVFCCSSYPLKEMNKDAYYCPSIEKLVIVNFCDVLLDI